LDDFIAAKMADRHIAGLSLAIIHERKIVEEKAYGFADLSGQTRVMLGTLFQAGSISKPLAAYAALHLVEQGRLKLDADVNTQLSSWKVPENEYTKEEKVTLRRILSHRAGLTVHGFPGTVMQQMILDITGKEFSDFMRDTVLLPLGMTNSTYQQPLPNDLVAKAATGYDRDGKAVKGRWHAYPEMAAAGLWTTASDLAQFVIAVQQACAGESDSVISQSVALQMLTDQKDHAGLGVFLQGSGTNLIFSHNGRDEGFDALMVGYATRGNGAVILINRNDDSGAVNDILVAIGRKYHWIW
jgi:CubicO group peptidase (beta-lactamase class C family)